MSDVMRLSGIASGYDTEAMIEEMMSGYQTKIDNQNKKLTKLQWKQEAYRDVTSKLQAFQNKYFDILKKDSYLMSPTTFSKFKSTVTSASGDDVSKQLNITTTSASKAGSYSLKVNQAATKTKLTGSTIAPRGFSLDLAKAAEANYETSVNDGGETVRSYGYALDVKVGDVSKTVEFAFDVTETDGAVDMQAYSEAFTQAINKAFEDEFGTTGRTGASVNGALNAEGEELFLNASASGDFKTLEFQVGGNATVSISEKTGNFGLAKAAKTQSIATQSCVTGTNAVAITIDGKTKTVSFQGVSSTYFDTKDVKGNEAILAEYNSLKEAAYRKANNLSSVAPIDQKKLEEFTYSTTQAAKDKNKAALLEAANEKFKDDGVIFTINDKGSMSASGKEFTITSVEGGTLGLTKGVATNKISNNETLGDMGIVDADSEFKINGKTIKVTAGTSVKDFVAAVNNANAGVTLSYSTVENRFVLTANDMGSAGNIDVEETDITKALGIAGTGAVMEEGKNAIIELDGVEIVHTSNSYQIDGTTIDFTDAVDGTEYNIDLNKDYTDVKQLVKDFVKDYNQLIDDVYGHIGTAPKRDAKDNTYEPLTDAEKEAMDEEEIEKWEEAAKKGVIYNDATVSSIMSQIRTSLYNSITLEDGTKFGLYNMGITTIPYDYNSHGKLEIDEDKFDAAFEKNAEAISKLFTDSENGLMKRFDTIIDNAVSSTSKSGVVQGSLIRKAGLESGSTSKNNEIYKQMQQINERISTLWDRYEAKEDYWWTVFTNLEKAMNNFNSQSSYLASYLGTGTMM